MSTFLWVVAVGCVWFLLGAVTALLIGPVLRRCRESLEAADASLAEEVAQPVDSR